MSKLEVMGPYDIFKDVEIKTNPSYVYIKKFDIRGKLSILYPLKTYATRNTSYHISQRYMT